MTFKTKTSKGCDILDSRWQSSLSATSANQAIVMNYHVDSHMKPTQKAYSFMFQDKVLRDKLFTICIADPSFSSLRYGFDFVSLEKYLFYSLCIRKQIGLKNFYFVINTSG